MLLIWMHLTYYWDAHGNMMSMLPIEVRGTYNVHLGGHEDRHEAHTSTTKPTKGKKPKIISICKRDEFLVESKETK